MGKNKSLEISNNISPRSQNNHIIPVKLTKNKLFGLKLGINCSLRPRRRFIRNSHIAYNRTIHLYFLDAKSQLLGSCCSWLYLPRRNNGFFCSGPNWTHFLFSILFPFILFIFLSARGVRDKNSSKQRQIELKFCPQVVLIVVQMPFNGFGKALIFTEDF